MATTHQGVHSHVTPIWPTSMAITHLGVHSHVTPIWPTSMAITHQGVHSHVTPIWPTSMATTHQGVHSHVTPIWPASMAITHQGAHSQAVHTQPLHFVGTSSSHRGTLSPTHLQDTPPPSLHLGSSHQSDESLHWDTLSHGLGKRAKNKISDLKCLPSLLSSVPSLSPSHPLSCSPSLLLHIHGHITDTSSECLHTLVGPALWAWHWRRAVSFPKQSTSVSKMGPVPRPNKANRIP